MRVPSERRPPEIRLWSEAAPDAAVTFDHDLEAIIVGFAGAGGSTEGIEEATGRFPDVAINHCREALTVHAANAGPRCYHILTDIWEVDPKTASRGRKVGLAWFSPDCRHYSRAKGTEPVSEAIRSLVEVIITWAQDVQPRRRVRAQLLKTLNC